MEVSQLLLETLEVLGDDDFKTFKWYLTEGSDSWDAIPVYRLEKAPRTETASLMTQAYGDDSAVNITAEILGKMNKKVVAEKLKKTYAGAVDGDLVKFTNTSKLNLCFHVSYCLTVSVFFFQPQREELLPLFLLLGLLRLLLLLQCLLLVEVWFLPRRSLVVALEHGM